MLYRFTVTGNPSDAWWVADPVLWKGQDLPTKISDALSQALAETGFEDSPVGYGIEIGNDDHAPSIDDHCKILVENMEGHDFFSVRYIRGESEIKILYEYDSHVEPTFSKDLLPCLPKLESRCG